MESEDEMEWQPIETANRPAEFVELAIVFCGVFVTRRMLGYWHEGDGYAGWATWEGKPLGFEPTHWRHFRDLPEERG